MAKKLSYIDLPCDRCGAKRVESISKNEDIKTTFGSSRIKTTIIMCTNFSCQGEFEKQRAADLIIIDNRRIERENRNKERQVNIAKTIANRKEFKFGQKP